MSIRRDPWGIVCSVRVAAYEYSKYMKIYFCFTLHCMRQNKNNNCQHCTYFTFSLLVWRFKGGSFRLGSSKTSFLLADQVFKPAFRGSRFLILRFAFTKRPFKFRSLKWWLVWGVTSTLASYVGEGFSSLFLQPELLYMAPKTANTWGYLHHCWRCDSLVRWS